MTTLQIVDSDDLSTVLFDLNGTNGVDAGSVTCSFGVGGAFNLGAPDPELVTVSPPSMAGGAVVFRRDPLVTSTWMQRIEATSYDELVQGVGELARLLAAGGVLKWVPTGSAETRYIDFEPSPAPAVFQGQALELFQVVSLFQESNGVPLQIIRQPYLRSTELDPTVNVLTNSTLTIDNDGTANRPDDFAWTSATPISAEDIDTDEHAYTFTITAGTVSLKGTHVGGTAADVWTGSVYAKSTSGTARLAMDVIFNNSGGTAVGTAVGGTTTLTSSWQRITGTGTAPANTAQVVWSAKALAAVSGKPWLRMAQLEEASSASTYRTGVEQVAFDPSSTSLPARVMPVYCWGNAPSPAKFTVESDSVGVTKYRVYRVSERAVEVLQATLYKQLEDGTLGDDTSSTADTEAVGDDCAQVAYTEPDPAFGTDSTASGAGTSIALAAPASLAVGDLMVAIITRGQITTQIAPPSQGWQLVGSQTETLGNMVMAAWFKIADATDVATSTFTFSVLYPAAGSPTSYRGWLGRFTGIDPDSPLDDFEFATETGTAITAPDITTSADDALIVTAYAGRDDDQTGTLTWTGPAGTTPTYTEQDDGTMDVTYRGQAVYTGVLATAGATGTKDATASDQVNGIALNMAFRKAPAAIKVRSTVTYSSLPPGDYDVWLTYRPTSASKDRLRVDYQIGSSPSSYIAFDDFIVDTLGASTFTQYQAHLFGRLHVPADYTAATVTARVWAGREQSSAANMNLDTLYLAPAFEHVATLTSPTQLANGEILAALPEESKVYHLNSSEQTIEMGGCDGPTPLLLEPGYQVIYAFPMQDAADGFADNAADVDAAPTVSVTHTPRYRV